MKSNSDVDDSAELKPALSVADLKRSNRRSAFRWGGFVVAFLALQLILGFSALVLSKSDPSVAVIPDYYQKSLDWDTMKALQAESDRLGWQVEVTATQDHQLEISLSDEKGVPIKIAGANLSLYRHARAADVKSRTLAPHEIRDGHLSVAGVFSHHGLWQIELEITDEKGTRFIHSRTLNVLTNGEES